MLDAYLGKKTCFAALQYLPEPHSLEKTLYRKEHLCNVCFFKKWNWRFLKHLAVLTLWICACLSIFSLQKDWIRIFWTFIDSKKVNPCFFLLVHSSATKKNPCFLTYFFYKVIYVIFTIRLCINSSIISIRIIIAKEKYPRISMGMLLQFRNIYEAVTILPTSSTEPIIIIGMNAAANIV